MKIEALNGVNFNAETTKVEGFNKATPSFSSLLKDSLSETNEKLMGADKALVQLASGQSTSLHQTMLIMEQAKISFQFLEQIRNRLMSAYQEIMREQI
ncbi:MAG: flagellar hook-basal body complex protein FliE [Tatlockia sp.]|nr:flagellar hook-basal body complex protein FliE [Tatlockia sp.]